MKYTHHRVLHVLADGTKVLYNRVQGKSAEDYASQCLRPLTEAEARESAMIDVDEDKRFADECEQDKVASEQQTDLW